MDSELFSILDPGRERPRPEGTAAFYQDLNLYQIIDRLARGWNGRVKELYMYLPETLELEEYRRAVFSDVKKDAVYNALKVFSEAMAETLRLHEEKEKVQIPIQKAVWHIREVENYWGAYEKLAGELQKAGISSEGLLQFLDILKELMESGGYNELLEQSRQLLDEIREFRFTITLDKDRISVAMGDVPGDGNYAGYLKKNGGGQKKALKNPFSREAGLTELESACLKVLLKKKPEFFKSLKSTAESCEEYDRPVLRRFEEEIVFYLSYAGLEREMKAAGFPFSVPDAPGEHRMQAEGVYDLALALSALSTGKKVVPNSFFYDEGESFFVLTGPNQGGKTTFARSLGQLVFFARMGLDVPAASAHIPFFPDIQTHFSVEESVETGRGKLKEELVRLAPMMEENRSGTFVIINELFTTAASYDAVIMGKRVLKHFTELGCTGIYVTHLKELVGACDGIVSLRAMLDESRMQTFEIRRGDAPDTPCAENLVDKYRLNYEQLKKRLL